jgi:mannosyltransferase
VAVRATSRTAVGWAVAGVLVAAVSLAQLPDLRDERTVNSRSQDLAGVAAVLRAHAQPGDAVIFIPPILRVGAMAYPDGFRQVDDVALHLSPKQAANLRGTNRKPPAVRDAMLSRQRIWVIGFDSWMSRTDQTAPTEWAVLGEHFLQVRMFPVHGVVVALYVRKNT